MADFIDYLSNDAFKDFDAVGQDIDKVSNATFLEIEAAKKSAQAQAFRDSPEQKELDSKISDWKEYSESKPRLYGTAALEDLLGMGAGAAASAGAALTAPVTGVGAIPLAGWAGTEGNNQGRAAGTSIAEAIGLAPDDDVGF